MRVLLKLELDCDADAAWHALQSPSVLREVVAPWLDFESVDGAFPTQWGVGAHRVRALAGGVVPAGEQLIDLSYPGGLPDGVRMLRDAGGGISGPLAAFRTWDHRMAVSPLPGGRTLFRDRLLASTGNPVADAALWYPTWLFWQWRGLRISQLARSWAYDPPGTVDAEARAGA